MATRSMGTMCSTNARSCTVSVLPAFSSLSVTTICFPVKSARPSSVALAPHVLQRQLRQQPPCGNGWLTDCPVRSPSGLMMSTFFFGFTLCTLCDVFTNTSTAAAVVGLPSACLACALHLRALRHVFAADAKPALSASSRRSWHYGCWPVQLRRRPTASGRPCRARRASGCAPASPVPSAA